MIICDCKHLKGGSYDNVEHHRLDPYPIPKNKMSLYSNEPWLSDKALLEYQRHREPEEQEDNVRIYIPMDLNKEAILRRMDRVIWQYGEATETNEMDFTIAVDMVISQLEIYNQIWFVRQKGSIVTGIFL